MSRKLAFDRPGMVGIQGGGPGSFYRRWYPSHADDGTPTFGGSAYPTNPRKDEPQRRGGRAAKERGGGLNVDSNWVKSQEEAKQGWKEKNQRKQAREDMLFQAMLERKQREHEAALEARERQSKMKMLSGLMGGNRGGFEEQIFNNAGAPQIVRLNKDNSAQMAQIIAQMLGR